MKIILREVESGREDVVQIAKNDLIVSLKKHAQILFPVTQGKLLQLVPVDNAKELRDEKFLGDYKSLRAGSKIDVIVSISQPYSRVDYNKIEKTLEEEIEKKPLEEFFDPTETDNDWVEDWTKGDEYLNYHPVDIYGQLSYQHAMIKKPKSFDPFEYMKESKRRSSMTEEDAEAAFKDMMNGGRNFRSIYVCQVDHFRFSFLHKFEGKWSGSAVHYLLNASDSKEPLIHACGSKMAFDPKSKCWIEQQVYTHKNGLANTRLFRYIPIADGHCEVRCDDGRFMESLVLRLKEESNDTLLLSGVSLHTGNTLLIESITINMCRDVEKRTRTVTRFDPSGKVIGVVVCEESKVIDAETGALTPAFF